MVLPILTIPNPILRQTSQPIEKLDKKVLEFITNLEETLLKKKNPPGVGLSAPQVGKNWRIFSTLLPEEDVADRDDLSEKRQQAPFLIKTYLNPTVISASKKLILGNEKSLNPKPKTQDPILEGCLSIPKIYGSVYRHQWVKLRFTPVTKLLSNSVTQSLPEKTVVFSGFTARVIQHELDHLDGILFIDRSIKQRLPLYEEKNGKLVEIKLS